ncbi:MAG: hypothetical protein ACLFN7_05400 [Candidatus Acetothermia bacterium]
MRDLFPRLLIFTLLIVLVSVTSFVTGFAQRGVDLAPNYPISLCDYTEPETTYQNLGLTLDYHFYDDPKLDDEGNINRGNASGNYAYIFSNPDYSINLDSTANISMSDSALHYNASGASRYNFYPGSNDFFIFGGLRLDFSDSYTEVAGIKASTGTGYGRFRNVTPMIRSALINRMLIEQGAVSENLSESTVRKIAQEIGGMVPETEIETVVEEIVNLIESEGNLTDSELGPVETLRIRENIEKGLRPSLCGWELRGGLSYEVLDPRGEERDILFNSALRFARPFTPFSRLALEADFSSTFEITSGHTINGLANYTYRFSENFDTELQYSYQYTQGKSESNYLQSFTAIAEAQLRENLGMSTTISVSDSTNYEELEKEITLGFSFDLL